MDTAPLPRIRAAAPGPRFLEGLAGLLSGGLVLIGLVLIILQLTAGSIAPGTGLAAASGPTWWRAVTQLGLGIIGEITILIRARLPYAVRAWIAVAMIVATAVVLYLCWWAY